MKQKIKVKIFLKSSPGTSANIEYTGRSRDEVYEMYLKFMNKKSGTLAHTGPDSIQIIDRTDVSMIDIQDLGTKSK